MLFEAIAHILILRLCVFDALRDVLQLADQANNLLLGLPVHLEYLKYPVSVRSLKFK